MQHDTVIVFYGSFVYIINKNSYYHAMEILREEMAMYGNVAIGVQSFEKIRTRKAFYVDKTNFIKEWWESNDDATLITRPRRFGKILNVSMLECFFSNKYSDRADLFEGCAIWKDEKYRQMQGTYPVIFLSFAKVKATNYNDMKYTIAEILFEVCQQNRYLLDCDIFSEKEKNYFNNIAPDMGSETAANAIHTLANFLSRYYEKNVIILLDEYDTPMQEAWLSGYWDEAVSFFRSFFNATFKTNPYLERGLITGITRISKASIFSDLNNLNVITTTSEKYAQYFGFTEQEVFQALDDFGFGAKKQGVKNWYDGFTFGSVTDIYNPWSITSFIANNAKYKPYWADTSSNGLVSRLIREGSAGIKKKFELLLARQHIFVPIDEQIIYHQLDDNENAIWSLLLASGYLKVISIDDSRIMDSLEDEKYELALTNHEVRRMFAKMIRGWFDGRARQDYNNFIQALLMDDVDSMNEFMNNIALKSFSSFDTAKGASSEDEPERFYHGFVLGLMVGLEERFVITSNRESGFGRYDVMLCPVNKERDRAYIFEFKVFKSRKEKNLEETAANALAQIEEKKYESELIAKGIPAENIRKYGFAFEGKKCMIRSGCKPK